MSEHEESNKVNKELKYSCDNDENNQPLLKIIIIPSDINDIQPRATQLWNCNEVGFDPNGMWHKVICAYKLFQGELMWKVKTGERAPLWCTLLVFARADENNSWYPSLCTKPRSTPNIFT